MSFTVTEGFKFFCSNLNFSIEKRDSISLRYKKITKRINQDFWSSTSEVEHSFYVGSYGRDTEVYLSDIDMLVILPSSIYYKYNDYSWNKQSSMLQEVKRVIEKTYSRTSIKADGQIISIPFDDDITFEVLPAFLNDDGSYTYANTNNGGSWLTTDPKAEINAINDMNKNCNNNLKRLCKMFRVWKAEHDVKMPGILIDILAFNFLASWTNKEKSYLYYDFMTRDFLEYISNQSTTQTKWRVMGSGRYIYCSTNFQYKAKLSLSVAKEAISFEKSYPNRANLKWREIYGTKFPSI